jgi:hypothetical protein
MRLTPERAAISFSLPRKSPGFSRFSHSASRTSATICADNVAARPAGAERPPVSLNRARAAMNRRPRE